MRAILNVFWFMLISLVGSVVLTEALRADERHQQTRLQQWQEQAPLMFQK